MANYMSLRDRISSPLEAGTSVLEVNQLPARLEAALEYVSSRLSRKGFSITLVAVRREYEIPQQFALYSAAAAAAAASASASASSAAAAAVGLTPLSPRSPLFPLSPLNAGAASPATPSRSSSGFAASSPIAALRNFVRTRSSRAAGATSNASNVASPLSPGFPATPQTPAWPGPPMFPTAEPAPVLPTLPTLPPTPSTASTTNTDSSMASSQSLFDADGFGIRFFYGSPLQPKESAVVQQTFERAARKFMISPMWFSTPVVPAALGFPTDVVHRTLRQGNPIFSTEGVTLLSLDRLYCLKAALASHSKTGSFLRLEDAMDDMRRLLLATPGRMFDKVELHETYKWMWYKTSSLDECMAMYERGYGKATPSAPVAFAPEMVDSSRAKTPSAAQAVREDASTQMAPEVPEVAAPPAAKPSLQSLSPQISPAISSLAVTPIKKSPLTPLGLDEKQRSPATPQGDSPAISSITVTFQLDIEVAGRHAQQQRQQRPSPPRQQRIEPEPEPEPQIRHEQPPSLQPLLTAAPTQPGTPPAKPTAPVLKLQTTFPVEQPPHMAPRRQPRSAPKMTPSWQRGAMRFEWSGGAGPTTGGNVKMPSPLGSAMHNASSTVEPLGADDDEDEDLLSADSAATARPLTATLSPGAPSAAPWNQHSLAAAVVPAQHHHHPWNPPSIDEVMTWSAVSETYPRFGPVTPNESNDLSPTTRGEWGILMSGDAAMVGRTANVGMCVDQGR